MHFVDRVFLSWYSEVSLAASLPAGATAWIFISVFLGTAGYVTTFVSQYDGAGQPHRIGAAIWQGNYFSLIATALLAVVALIAEPLFTFVGHDPEIRREEIICFQVLVLGGGGFIFSASLSAFYSGRGWTKLVMWVNVAGALLNGLLDYVWIFGKWGFPEWGIFGATLATVVAPWAMSIFYFGLLFLPHNRRDYHTLSASRFDRELFTRFIRFGLPSGLQFMIDVFAFTVFLLLVGRIGKMELAASNVAFAVNQLAFMPMVGLSMGTAVLVGRYVGAGFPEFAARSVSSAYRMTVGYMVVFSLFVVAFPEPILAAFHPSDDARAFEEIAILTTRLLWFVAAYSVLDASIIIFVSALKGAGDTAWVLGIMVVVAVTVLIVPVFVACVVFGAGIYAAWTFLSVYVCVLAVSYWLRYRTGKWKSMRVIEHAPSPAATMVEGPVVET